jgi:hypothetical protein
MHIYPVVGRNSYITSRGYGMRNGKLIDAVNSGNVSLYDRYYLRQDSLNIATVSM